MNNKNFTVADLERINKNYEATDESATLTITFDETEEFQVRVKPKLSLLEYLQFASDVADSVFYEPEDEAEGAEVRYVPQYMNIALQRAVLVYYTDMDINDADPEALYAFCVNTGIVNQVLELVNAIQFDALLSEIDKLIEFKKNQLVYTAPKSPILEMFSALTKNVAEKAGDPDFYRQVFSAAAAANDDAAAPETEYEDR